MVDLAKAEIASFFGTLDLGRPESVRDALVEIVPLLVQEYGDLAATAAAEWYEQVSPNAVNARLAAGGFPSEGVVGSVRASAGHLFGDDPGQTLTTLMGGMQRFIAYSGRATVARNVELDSSRPRFARVTSGAQTCAWCTLMASRGFVYYTRAAAGEFDHWHDDCDCQIVPQWDAERAHIDGYDPDEMYAQYQAAREAVNGRTDKEIASAMRRLFPESFTDGVSSAS